MRRASRALAKASLALLVGALLVVAVQPPSVFGVLQRLFPGMVWRVATEQPLVALSFDDGPDEIRDPTRTIAALPGILEAGRAKGLSFVSVGELLKAADPR